ncbi:MAG: beta-galactosidase [Bacteroidales bacterium]|nr:beta-galactosidase [Bacteroidales bacterium]
MKLLFLSLLLSINLSGTWQFSIDRTPEGVRPTVYTDEVTLPGSMLTNGKGDDVSIHTQWVGSLYDSSYFYNPAMAKYREPGNLKFPFFLTPEKHYVGNAWYKKTVKVPASWQGRKVTLYLERPHIETTLLVNGKEAGHQMSLCVPHQFDITDYVEFGQENTLEIKIYNGIENVCVGQDSHSVTDQTQGDWNGITGKIELRDEPIVWRCRVEPDVDNASARIFLNDSIYDISLKRPLKLWDEYNPYLYTVKVNYQGQNIPVSFGMRKVSIEGRNILLNGQVLKLRGTVGNCCFPETGYAPTDVASWEKIFRKCKEYGLNAMRFHSYCPPEAAFTAADKVGFYLQAEGPSWPNHGVKLGNGMAIDKYLIDECKAIIDQYGAHPSLLMMGAGNEPAGNWVQWCNRFVKEMHRYDPTRIYCDASVGGGWAWAADAEFHIKGGARGLDEWKNHAPQTMDDFTPGMDLPRNFKPSAEKPTNTEPIVCHETGQWCAFPDLTETSQYTGVYKARNFEIFADLLKENGMEGQSRKFLMASGRLQTLAYKFDIERNLRTPDYAGFLLLGLNDYSGQGTALVGALNVHWMEKGYVTANEWKEFCSDVVPLARFPKFVYGDQEQIQIGTMLYNATFGREKYSQLEYVISSADTKSTLQKGKVQVGGNILFAPKPQAKSKAFVPRKLTLTLKAGNHSNHWDFWVYPTAIAKETEADPANGNITGIMVTDTLDAKALFFLNAGGKVLLTAGGKIKFGNDVSHQYLPVFWNTSWFKMRPPHTTGSYIENTHPIFRDFPTDDWQDLNWWELVNRTQVMNLAEFPAGFQPIVQPIDTWHVSRKLGMLFEAKVGKGRLVMTTMNLSRDLDKRLVARQLRYSILKYMQSNEFQPQFELDPSVIRNLFTKTAPPVNMFTKDTPDELKPKLTSSTTDCNLQLKPGTPRSKETFAFGTSANGKGGSLLVDNKGFIMDGKGVIPVMGEIHFSRVPRKEWKTELLKMKAGGVNIVATYIFWIHHEATEGQFDWTGNKDLRAFVQTCQEAGLPVVLRVGPFCHGEVYLGGIPEWLVDKAAADPKQYKLRSTAPGFLAATRKLYEEIFGQVDGLLYKQGGPIVGMQIENECRGPWPYYMALKDIALQQGFDLPFYTRTGWPKLNGREEFGKLLPLYGDYADGFWERTNKDMPGGYPNAFVFKSGRVSENIATETFKASELKDDGTPATSSQLTYPYLTCELGGGMQTAYHRRVRIFPKDALALAICKVGSGSNLPGYYMYHGGTNPGRHLSEIQASKVTNYNDLSEINYDFQAPLGQMGQYNESYHWTRRFHLFLSNFGEELRDMDPQFPAGNLEDGRKDSALRYAVRTDGKSGFVFVNNYMRMFPLSDKEGVRFLFTTADGQKITFPRFDILKDEAFVLPFGLRFCNQTIDWATAQPLMKLEGKEPVLVLAQIRGIEPQISVDGQVFSLSTKQPVRTFKGWSVRLLSVEESLKAYQFGNQLYLSDIPLFEDEKGRIWQEEFRLTDRTVSVQQTASHQGLREVKTGGAKVAERPTDADFEKAAVWTLGDLDRLSDYDLLQVDYQGDVARVYADGQLVQDNQWNGNPMLVRVSDLKGKRAEIRILPLGKDYPVYLQPDERKVLAEAPDGLLCQLKQVHVIEHKQIQK